MEARGILFAAVGAIASAQSGRFVRLGADVAELADCGDREVAFVRGPLSLARPASAGRSESGSKR